MVAAVDIDVRAGQLGINWSEINLDSIQLPPGDDFGIASDDEAVYHEDQSAFDTGFGNIIVVDHLPVVLREKYEKIGGVVKLLLFEQIRKDAEETYKLNPSDADNLTRWGGALLELAQFHSISDAKQMLQGAFLF
ncbi:PREDICTED: eukaryotic translation initiation factor 3 subunit B-like [Camelina sativa]|uniref:Eukaryotic translation initiation factor 3 subunit B-like n=1 Tax=Camelina sativa TaxID=90675 RepID=A0ABM1RET0_CAMSA|nr:PREDICTED: eukaryotic translation initiation factor 3 subunit B-like [Camelina sativa]